MKRSFSLIEILVSLLLFSTLASLLFGFYVSVIRVSEKEKIANEKTAALVTMRVLLQRSLCKAALQNKEGFVLKEGALHFYFDNGIDPDPDFSSRLEATLFLDNQGRFMLIENAPKSPLKREFVLRENVRHLNFEMLPDEGEPFAVRLVLDDENYSFFLQSVPTIVGFK